MKSLKPIVFVLLVSSAQADTLTDAVQHGLISNPEVLFNTAKSLTSRQGIDKARGAYYPTVDVNAGFGREKSINPTTEAIDGPGNRILNRTESNIEVRQNLFAGGGIVNEVKRSEFEFQAQKLKTQGAAEDIALDVVNQYLLVLLHQKLVGYAKVNLSAHRSVFEMIKERSDAGISREAEVDQAVARLALAESNLIVAEANLREVKINYAKVVGKWPEHLVYPQVPKNSELPVNLNKAIEQGLENHPTLRSSYADVKEAKSQYEVARAAYYPKVDFVLSAAQNRNLDGLIGPNNDRLAMIRMTYNLFRGGSDDANVRLTSYQVQEAYETKNKALIDLREAIRLSWNAWVSSSLRLKPLQLHVTSARKTQSAYQEQFKVGKRTLLDLLDSQNEFYQAEIDYARGQTDEVYARYRILNGMGLLLCYLKARLPVNVINNDVFTSAQTHILLNKNMDGVPFPDNTDKTMYLEQPVKNMETTPLTPMMTHKNTMKPLPAVKPIWYVSAGHFKDIPPARALHDTLKKLGFNVFIMPTPPSGHAVLVGPFEYRGNAANAMERLKEIAHVPCRLVTFRQHYKRV